MSQKRTYTIYHIISVFIIVVTVLSCAMPGERKRMEELLEKAEKMNSNYVSMENATFVDTLLVFYNSHGSEEERIRANYMMGCFHRDRGDSPMALESYMKAVSLADTANASCNYELLGKIYGQMAALFHKQRYPQKEIDMWNVTIAMAEKAQDTVMMMQSMMMKSSAYWLAGDKKQAADFSRKTYSLCKKIGADSLAARELVTTIAFNLDRNELKEAKREIDEYISKSGLVYKDGTLHESCEFFYFYLGRYYEKMGVNDSALFYYKKLLEYKNDIANVENGYRGLMNLYRKLYQPDSIVKYAELYADANDTANIKNSANEISRIQSLYNYSEHQQRALEKSDEVKKLWCILFCCLVVAVTIVWLSYFLYKRYKVKMQYDLGELNRKYVLALHDYNDAVAEYNRYKEEGKSYEASLKVRINKLEDVLSAYSDGFDSDKLSLEQCLRQHPIVGVMRDYASKAEMPTAGDWSVFMGVVEKCLPDLIKAVQDLTYEEQRLCALTRLNFSPTDISNLTNIKRQRVTNIRSFLNKKMFNEEGARTFSENIASL